ncbi:MAG: DUF2914 domain-containing protein [Candidatus Methylomirabilales bacterium]
MRKWTRTAAITLVAVGFPSLALPQQEPSKPEQASLKVVRDVVTTGVVNREPVDAATVFPPSVGQLYYFTEVQGATTPTEIIHTWYYKGKKVAEVPLSVEAGHWRTWSSKRILESWIGPWKVEAVDADGRVLAFETFDLH